LPLSSLLTSPITAPHFCQNSKPLGLGLPAINLEATSRAALWEENRRGIHNDTEERVTLK